MRRCNRPIAVGRRSAHSSSHVCRVLMPSSRDGMDIPNAYRCSHEHWVVPVGAPAGGLDCEQNLGWCHNNQDPPGLGVELGDPDCPRNFGHSCSVVCGEGFRPDGPASREYICGVGRQWAPVAGRHLKCVKVCPTDPEGHASFSSHCTHDVGQECTARCDPGYVSSSPRTTTIYICSEDGAWVPSDSHGLGCALRGCPEKQPVLNAYPCRSDELNSTCKASCQVSYPAHTPFILTGQY